MGLNKYVMVHPKRRHCHKKTIPKIFKKGNHKTMWTACSHYCQNAQNISGRRHKKIVTVVSSEEQDWKLESDGHLLLIKHPSEKNGIFFPCTLLFQLNKNQLFFKNRISVIIEHHISIRKAYQLKTEGSKRNDACLTITAALKTKMDIPEQSPWSLKSSLQRVMKTTGTKHRSLLSRPHIIQLLTARAYKTRVV